MFLILIILMNLKTNNIVLEKQIINLLNNNNCFCKIEIFEEFENDFSKKQITKSLICLIKKQIINFDLFETYYLFVEE